MKIKVVLLIVIGFLSLKGFSQLGYYYENGKSATVKYLVSQKGSKYVTQITHYNYEFVAQRIHNFLTYSVNKVAMEETQSKTKGEVTTYSRRYKSEFSDEINTIFTITTEYTTQEVAGESVIKSAKIYGYESYIGKFIETFWNQPMNVADKKSGEVMNFNFLDDNVRVFLKTDKETYMEMATLEISNNSIGSFTEFKERLEDYLEEFNSIRNQKTFKIKDENLEAYNKNESTIHGVVESHLRGISTTAEFNGTLTITANVDTNGTETFELSTNDFPGVNELKKKLNSMNYKHYVKRGYEMRTSDTYTFNVNFYNEIGSFFNKKKIINYEEVSDRYKGIIDARFSEINQGRGIYQVQIQNVALDNTEGKDELKTLSFTKKTGPLGYAVGGAVLAGAALYYFVL